jgi:hypothetical protein
MWHLGRRKAGRKNLFRPKKTLKDGELEMATRKGEKKEGKKDGEWVLEEGIGWGKAISQTKANKHRNVPSVLSRPQNRQQQRRRADELPGCWEDGCQWKWKSEWQHQQS